MASEVGDVTGQCVALQVLGTVEAIAGRSGAAREHLQRAMALHDSGHVRTTSYIIPDLFHAGALLYLDEIEEGLRATDRSRRRHVERGALTQLPLSHMLGAAAHFFTGAWQDADAEIEAGLDGRRRDRQPELRAVLSRPPRPDGDRTWPDRRRRRTHRAGLR